MSYLDDLYKKALKNPAAPGQAYQGFFNEAAQGYAAPAMRDFAKTLSGVQANTAARFGGNASTEESRQEYNTSDLFSRNLSEALARLAPQAAQLGLQYTRELGQGKRSQKGPPWAKLLGTLGGGALGFAAGGPAGALKGATTGGAIFN